MHKKHLVLAGLAFLLCALSAYFGVRIYNANENFLLTELNVFDKIYHDDIKLVPQLSFMAALFTAPFIFAIFIIELWILKKTVHQKAKNIAIGLTVAIFVVMIFDLITLFNPRAFDFSKWGFVWICLGIIIMGGNLLSFAIYKFREQ